MRFDDGDDDWDAEGFADLASGVAAAFLCGDWTAAGMLERARDALEDAGGWLDGLVARARAAFPQRPDPEDETLASFLVEDEALMDRWQEGGLELRTRYLVAPEMRTPRRFAVPELRGLRDVAAWLRLDVGTLEWLADAEGWLAREPDGPLQHYRYHRLRKRSGGARVVEAPKEALKSVQRAILRRILDAVPPHDAAHGFRKGRSILSFVEPHCARDLVVRMDLRHFFPSVGAARVAATFRALGYPRGAASLLASLLTTRTPDAVLEGGGLDPGALARLRRRHLPQGAPTSPAMANLCAYGLDVRLSAAAAAVSASYTRYADDLAFSGGPEFREQAGRFRRLVVRIVAEEGFDVHWRKTRWMRPCSQQRLTGLVLNHRPRPSRAEFDRLKATLHNCARHGPAGQNRDGHADLRAHLAGRVAWFHHVDPRRGERLRALFERIAWDEQEG